jgi:hypothetical protein
MIKFSRGLFGRARLHQLKSEFADEGEEWAKKEEWLEKAMADYGAIMGNEETPDELFRWNFCHKKLFFSKMKIFAHQSFKNILKICNP